VQDPAFDSIGQSPLRRLLSTTWPLFRAFRVDVRVSWTIAIWPLFFTFGFAKWMSLGEALLWGAAWTIGLFLNVWTHEMGHIAMGRRLGVDTERMTLRGLGGLAHLDGPAQTPRDEMLISLAGPATHLAWMAVLYPLTWLLESSFADSMWFWMLGGYADLQLWMMIFNLLPVYPLDGGRTLRGALALRMHANKASYHVSTLGFVGNAVFLVVGLLSWLKVWDPLGHGPYGFLLAWLGFEGIQANRRLRLQARHGDIYADHDPFQKTLMASKAALREMDREEAKEREHREKRAAERRKLQATVDRLLDRITERGGVDALSSRERRELEKASKRLSEME
jgi:Zn-dependent protease